MVARGRSIVTYGSVVVVMATVGGEVLETIEASFVIEGESVVVGNGGRVVVSAETVQSNIVVVDPSADCVSMFGAVPTATGASRLVVASSVDES